MLFSGSNITVKLATIPCAVLERANTYIICETGPTETEKNGVVQITIDSAAVQLVQRTYEYIPDPVVMKVEPRKTTISGGIMVIFLKLCI